MVKKVLFLAHEDDTNLVKLLTALGERRQDGVDTLRISATNAVPESDGELRVAVFTQPNGSCLVGSSSTSRLASHRIAAEHVPTWASDCRLLIAVRGGLENRTPPATKHHKQTKWSPREIVANWVNVAWQLQSAARDVTLLEHAPWGCPPTDRDQFKAYVAWVLDRLGVEPQNLRPSRMLKTGVSTPLSYCTLPGHRDCSFSVAARHRSHLVMMTPGSLTSTDTLIYGTSDPTTNPAEVWMTAQVAARANCSWQFFNYPRGSWWTDQDVRDVFGPHPFTHTGDPSACNTELGLDDSVLAQLTFLSLQQGLDGLSGALALTLSQIVESIKRLRTGDQHSFAVVNQNNGGVVKRIFGTDKDDGYLTHRNRSITDLLGDGTIKLGGSIIYYLIGYLAAAKGLVLLHPHNVRGGVWSATAAGAADAGTSVRLYPIGGLDFMTRTQWELWRGDQNWRKAPAASMASLNDSPLNAELVRRLVDRCEYCAVQHDPDSGAFSFVSNT